MERGDHRRLVIQYCLGEKTRPIAFRTGAFPFFVVFPRAEDVAWLFYGHFLPPLAGAVLPLLLR